MNHPAVEGFYDRVISDARSSARRSLLATGVVAVELIASAS